LSIATEQSVEIVKSGFNTPQLLINKSHFINYLLYFKSI
jgi:hypothetical protein